MTIIETALHYKNDLGLSVIPQKLKQSLVKWADYQENKPSDDNIKKWWLENPNAGIAAVVGSISGVIVIDCDSPEAIKEIESSFPGNLVIPCAESPRGGRHYYFACSEKIQKQVNWKNKIDLQAEKSMIVMPPSVGENGKPYKWIVEPKSKNDFPAIPASLQASINNNKYTIRESDFVKNKELNNVKDVKNCYIYSSKGTRDDDLFHAGHLLFNGNATEKEMAFILKILAKTCDPEFAEGDVEEKIKSIIKRAMRKERNISQEVREWALLNDVNFLLKDCYNELKIVKKEEMTNARVTINAMVKEGLLSKDDHIRGKYTTIKELEENIIDLNAADNTNLTIKFPFGIHRQVKIMPKNIIIVAGESNAGKSAFLLNVAAKNMIDHPVFYFSSEMGGAELKERLQNFNEKMPFIMWKHCTFIERSLDFDIAIRPDAINIIDFLEIHDEFYKIGGFIKKIFDKLNKGVAIIAIQKNPGRDDGLGGQRSLEKARLYLSMSPGLIRIVKAKNWMSAMQNPNKTQKEFKLSKGMIFWEDPEKKDRWEKYE